MGLFDIFTGAPQKKAAQQSRQYIDQTRGGNDDLITGGLGTSLANLAGGFSGATGAVNQGYEDAVGATNAGYNGARASYGDLAGLGKKYGGATSLALGALGVNGQAGTDAARSAFTAGPAYNFNMDQGLEAINRRRAAGGMLNSGNADRDSQIFGAGLASNEYDKWMGNLLGFTNPELAATSGVANGMANVNMSSGRDLASLAFGRGSMLAGLSQNYGQNAANMNMGAANARVGNNNAMLNPYLGTYQKEADAAMGGSKNMWGLGMAAAQMAMGMPPTSLSSLGGAGASQANPGVAGGGYAGAGGQVYPGPGYYGR